MAITVHPSAIVDAGATIGAGTRVWHWVHVCSQAVIGEKCSLGQNVFVGNDVKIGNAQILKGQKVVMYFGAANRDPAKFDRPETLDLSRPDNAQLAFGTGPHGCLGQHIARIEIDAMLSEVLTRMDHFELAAPPEWLASNFISGPRTMPIRFKPKS